MGSATREQLRAFDPELAKRLDGYDKAIRLSRIAFALSLIGFICGLSGLIGIFG